jgi:hypothetical protein
MIFNNLSQISSINLTFSVNRVISKDALASQLDELAI